MLLFHSWWQTPSGLNLRTLAWLTLKSWSKCHKALRCRYKTTHPYFLPADVPTKWHCKVRPRCLRLSEKVPHWTWSLFGLDILRGFLIWELYPFLTQYFLLGSESAESLERSHNLRLLCVQRLRQSQLTRHLQCNVLSPSCCQLHFDLIRTKEYKF